MKREKKELNKNEIFHSINLIENKGIKNQESKIDVKNLSFDEISNLLIRAEACNKNNECNEALNIFSGLICSSFDGDPYLPVYLNLRASVYEKLREWDSAITDLESAICLNQDFDGNYLSLGATITWKLFYTGNFHIGEDDEILMKSIYYYKECLKRNPSNAVAWLNIIETYIFLQRWDDAISYYGLSKSYMDSKEHILARAWLGCIALALDGGYIGDEDVKPLIDQTVQYETIHDTNQIKDFLSELKRINFDSIKLRKAINIHNIFMSRINIIDG